MDSKATVEIKFTVWGRTYETSMHINYCPNEDDVDDRIIEWLRDCYRSADAHKKAEEYDANL